MDLEEIPVAVFAFKRPELLAHALVCLRDAGFRNLIGFSDGPRGPEDVEGVTRCREVLHSVSWGDMQVVERPGNYGLRPSVLAGVGQVLGEYDRLVLIEDDIFVAPGFGRYVAAGLDHYADEPRVASVLGLRMPFSRRCFTGYDYDAFTLPRIFTWGLGLWRRSWETFDFDDERVVARLKAEGVRPELAGADLAHMIRSAMVLGTLHGAYDVTIGANMLLNDQVSVSPTWNMVLHEQHEHAEHVRVPPRWARHSRWEAELQPDLGALRFPPVEPDPRILKAFKVFRENPKGWTARRFVPRSARQALRRIRGTYDVFR